MTLSLRIVCSLLVCSACLLPSSAFSQITYQWTNPNDGSVSTLTLPSNWKFSVLTSPDGTISTGPNGPTLYSPTGTWAWGSVVAGRPGEYNVNFNNASVGVGTVMEINHGGKLYVNTAHAGWFLWNGSGFSSSPAP